MRHEAQQQEDGDEAGPRDGSAPAPRVLLFAVSGPAIDARSLGARLAQWLGPKGHVTCWGDGDLPSHTDPVNRAEATARAHPAVMIVSHRALVLAAAHLQLAAAGHALSCLQTNDGQALRRQLHRDDEAILLLDEQWLRELDTETDRWLAELARSRRTLLLCDHASGCRADCALARGLHGCLSIDAAAGVWARAVAAVARGELWLPRAVLQQAAVEARQPPLPPLALEGLTPREAQAVSLVREGLANKEIARRLGIGEDTVKKHLQHAFGKLGVHRRTQVALARIGSQLPRSQGQPFHFRGMADEAG